MITNNNAAASREIAAQRRYRLEQGIGIAAVAQRPSRRQSIADRPLGRGFDLLERLAKGDARWRRDIDGQGFPAIDMGDLGRADAAQQGCDFAQRHRPAIGCNDRSAFNCFGIDRFQAAHDHAHPLAFRHIFAEIKPVTHGPHSASDLIAGHAQFGDPPVIGSEPQFGNDNIGIGIGADHRAGNGGADRVCRHQSRLSQRFVIFGLQIEFDIAIAAKISKQAALCGKGLDIREAGQNFAVDDSDHLFDPGLVLDPDACVQAPGIDEQIIVEQLGLLVALQIGVEPLDDLFGDFRARRFQRLAGRQADPGVDGIAFHVRQIVGLAARENRRLISAQE